MAIKTKSIFQPANVEDGRRILITRFYPRGIRKSHFDEWALSLSPSSDLLFRFKRGHMRWPGFRRRFIAELKNNVESLDTIQALTHISRDEDVTLLCFEKSGQACHRHIVRDIIASPETLDR